MKLSSCLIRDLTPRQYRAVYSLNLRRRGFSRGHLHDCFQQNHEHSRIIMAHNRGQLVGWALMIQCLNQQGDLQEYSTNLYVRRSMRRKGIGLALMGELGRFLDRTQRQAHVCIWSKSSDEFYTAIGHPRVRVIVSPAYQAIRRS